MSIPLFLAATVQEIRAIPAGERNIGWMSCHFSPNDSGLADIPYALPPDSMLILDDRIAITNHNPTLVAEQLSRAVIELKCSHVLLDWERSATPESIEMLRQILHKLPCPAGVTASFSEGLSCAVFLPPIPPHVLPSDYLKQWPGRKIWLEAALDGSLGTLTTEGCSFQSVPFPTPAEPEHFSEKLHCHYSITADTNQAQFHFRRTREDLDSLLSACEKLGVSLAVGLYQELG